MKKDFEFLISYINDNYRFGSKIKQHVIDQWFLKYQLEIEERFAIYNELDSLDITIIDLPNGFIKSVIFKLFKCIKNETEIEKSILTKWLNENGIEKELQEKIISELERENYIIIENRQENNGLDLLNDLIDDDLDIILEDEEFLKYVDSLNEVIDKSRNIDYLINLQSEDEKQRIESLSNLVIANKKLVWKIVKHYQGFSSVGFDLNDMYQAGVIGLLKAAERFEVSRGFQFSTYATFWIRQSITRGIADYSTLIRIPVHYREKMNKFLRVENELWNELARPATTEELALAMDEPVKVIEDLRFYIVQSNMDSLDRLVGDDQSTTLTELIEDDKIKQPEEEYYHVELKEIFKKILKIKLTEKEMQILMYRFGFYNDETMTLEEIGQIYNVTRERIRQIEAKALKKLKKSKDIKELKEYLYES